MTDFVLENENMAKQTESEMSKDLFKLAQYANFLKQPLTLGMFVPSDENGNVLEFTERHNCINEIEFDQKLLDFQDAKSKVLFNGFYLDETYKREKLQLPYLTNGKISISTRWTNQRKAHHCPACPGRMMIS